MSTLIFEIPDNMVDTVTPDGYRIDATVLNREMEEWFAQNIRGKFELCFMQEFPDPYNFGPSRWVHFEDERDYIIFKLFWM
jgi:hypothetical protein